MTAATMTIRRRSSRAEEPEWLVWLLVVVLLGVGLLARTVVLNRTKTFNGSAASVSYPAAWIALNKQDANEMFAAGQPFDSGLFPARFSLLQMPASSVSANAKSLGDFALQWSDRGSRDLLAYKVLDIEPVRVAGQDAVRIDYVYVGEPALAAPNSIPVVARGADILVKRGDNLTVVRLNAASDAFDGLAGTWNRILNSLELK
jgi:hypothetical protein